MIPKEEKKDGEGINPLSSQRERRVEKRDFRWVESQQHPTRGIGHLTQSELGTHTAMHAGYMLHAASN